jgi:hypothetical protein
LPDNLPVERVVEPPPCACGKCGSIRLRKLGACGCVIRKPKAPSCGIKCFWQKRALDVINGQAVSAMQQPISLSDDELATVLWAAKPLHHWQRCAFLTAVADRLRHETEIGPGTISRITRAIVETGQYGFAEVRLLNRRDK